MMQISAPGRELIELFEGCEKAMPNSSYFTTYYDSVGVLTLGYGHTNLGNIPPHIIQGDVWTQAQCDNALSNDLSVFEKLVTDVMAPLQLVQYQFDALGSFDFNTGDLAKSSIPSRLKNGDITGAMSVLLEYDHAGGKVLAGLTRRRHAERLMFLGEVQAALVLAGASASPPAPMAKAATQVTVNA
jgi:lysozyme